MIQLVVSSGFKEEQASKEGARWIYELGVEKVLGQLVCVSDTRASSCNAVHLLRNRISGSDLECMCRCRRRGSRNYRTVGN